MCTRLHRQLGVFLFAVLCAHPLGAQNVRGSASVTTDYIHRGISQTGGEPALQGSFAYWHATGWYGGAWVSSVSSARRYQSIDGSAAELNVFMGYSRRLTPEWVIDTQVVRYLYPGDPAPVSYDYTELGVSVAYRERFYASVMASPDTTMLGRYSVARQQTAYTYEVAMQQPLSPWLTLSAGGGYYDISDLFRTGYLFGGASLAVQMGRVVMELGYYATDNRAREIFGTRLAGRRTVLTTTFNF